MAKANTLTVPVVADLTPVIGQLNVMANTLLALGEALVKIGEMVADSTMELSLMQMSGQTGEDSLA